MIEVQEHIVNAKHYPEGLCYTLPQHSGSRKLKRGFDITFSLLVIILVYPLLFPVVYVLIKLETGGRVFFVQKRNGLHNKVFDCYKFRSMVVNDDADHIAATENDNRITRVGKLLRVSGIDELPQFINVLKGDMSIVGPRPHMINDNLKFEQIAYNYKNRNRVKPGITGLAQVNGYKGNATDPQSIRMRTKIDILYVKNRTFPLDLIIISATVKMMFVETFKMISGK